MSATTIETSEYANSYLTDGFTLRSWLLTTDHKRIALLYLGSITFFFFIGGAAAALIRYNLLVPEGMIASAETYNRIFTMHGVVMVWFFLIPAVPVTLGNFVVPLMLGARDLAFPKLNLISWYLFIIAGMIVDLQFVRRRRRYGMDLLHPARLGILQRTCGGDGRRHLHRGLFFHCDRTELHRHDPSPARPGHDLVQDAGVPVVALCHQRHPGACDAGIGDDADPPGVRAHLSRRRVRSGAGRRSAAVSAPVLVLLPPRCLRHDPSGLRRRQRDHSGFLAQTDLWLLLSLCGAASRSR